MKKVKIFTRSSQILKECCTIFKTQKHISKFWNLNLITEDRIVLKNKMICWNLMMKLQSSFFIILKKKLLILKILKKYKVLQAKNGTLMINHHKILIQMELIYLKFLRDLTIKFRQFWNNKIFKYRIKLIHSLARFPFWMKKMDQLLLKITTIWMISQAKRIRKSKN